MRNAVTLRVGHNLLDVLRLNFKLFRNFSDAHAIVEVIDNLATHCGQMCWRAKDNTRRPFMDLLAKIAMLPSPAG